MLGRPTKEVAIIDRYTMSVKAVYPSVNDLAGELKLKANTIRLALHRRKSAYDCYFVYKRELKEWKPAKVCWRRVRGLGGSEELKRILNS